MSTDLSIGGVSVSGFCAGGVVFLAFYCVECLLHLSFEQKMKICVPFQRSGAFLNLFPRIVIGIT